MKFNFKRISAILGSLLMIGMSAGIGAAATFPAPFVENGVGNYAVVYGSNAPAGLDQAQATSVAQYLQSLVKSGGGISISDQAVSLDTSSTRIWLNTSLNTARSSITKTEMPNLLADTTFSGNVDAKITHTIKLQAGSAAGGDNSGKVIFAKQPRSSNDPVIGISMGLSANNALYNASAIFSKAVNFTSSDSEGEEITLFGQKFTVSSSTDDSNLVLLKEAKTIDLIEPGENSANVTIGGNQYTIQLISSSDTEATIKVTDSSGKSSTATLSEAGASKKVQGLEVAVKSADETNQRLSATLIVGAQKVTLTHGSNVKVGSDDKSVDGTLVYLVGGTGATTEIAISVFAPSSSQDAIIEGSSFVDPVFGTFQFSFEGISSPLEDSNREILEVGVSGDDTLTLKMIDHRGEEGTFDWAHNESDVFILGDDSNNPINVIEMANLTEDEYVVLGNEEYGYLLKVDNIYNDSSSAGSDRVTFVDVLSGETISARSPTSEGTTTLSLGGKEYTITYSGPGGGAGSGGWATIKYPTGDSPNASSFVVYPTIQTKAGALVAFYQPLTINLSNVDGNGNDAHLFKFPDGDGYTSVGVANIKNETWSIGGTTVNTSIATDKADVTIGRLKYSFVVSGINQTQLRLVDPDNSNVNITTPALIVFEGKDNDNNYEVIVIDTEGEGTSSNGVGVNTVSLSSPTKYSATLQSNSDITKYVDWFGTLITVDASESDQKTATIAYPGSQVYAKIFVDSVEAATGSTGTTSTDLGAVLVTDTQVNSVSGKNLIVVGGSCINSVAASLLNVPVGTCGTQWTQLTGIGENKYLIQSFDRNGKVALLVAGYEAGDTAAAVSKLINDPSAINTQVGKKYVGVLGSSGSYSFESSA
ncbi:MAG: hypothetical protein QXU40_00700 [Candidatus Pacearchaeota archaeon]